MELRSACVLHIAKGEVIVRSGWNRNFPAARELRKIRAEGRRSSGLLVGAWRGVAVRQTDGRVERTDPNKTEGQATLGPCIYTPLFLRDLSPGHGHFLG